MSEEPIKYPYVADLPRKVRIEGESGVEEYNLHDLVALAKESSQQRDELTEVGCQMYGYMLYVRLDWSFPERAKNDLEQIRTALQDVMARSEGYASWQAKKTDVKQSQSQLVEVSTQRPSEMEVMRSRVASLEKQVYELQRLLYSDQGVNELAQAIERRIVSRLKYGRDPRIEVSKETNQ